MATIKLAEALLRRKELHNLVERIGPINQRDLYDVKIQRKQISDTIDDIALTVPKVKLSSVTATYNYYSKHLRLIDAAIQRANWTTDLEVDENAVVDFVEPEPEKEDK